MRKRMCLTVVAALAVFPLAIHATNTQDYVDMSDQWISGKLATSGPVHEIGHFDFPTLAEEDSFVTYVYTYGEILIFSYADENDLTMYNTQGHVVWADTMQEDEYTYIQGLESGVYKVDIPKGSSVLSGDPFVEGLGCWFAVDQNSKPLSEKLLTVGPKINSISDELVVVFSYQNGTHVTIEDVDSNKTVWEGGLDSASYYLLPQEVVVPRVYSVEASNPVSVGTFTGVVGTYVPAFNGTFTGQDFMTYCHDWTEGPQDLNIIPWEDNVTVVVTDLDDPADTIWQVVCDKKGEIKGTSMPEGMALHIHADKDISVAQVPWASFGSSTIAFYMARGIDRYGSGLGNEFYIPVERSFPGYESKLHVIAFVDSTEVKVTQIPREGGAESDIWEGSLNQGEFYCYTTPATGDGHSIYHVTSNRSVATVGSCHGMRGSDFYPVITYAELLREGISEPEITPRSDWQVTSAIGRQIDLHYANYPRGFHAVVFDATGRKVDELHSVSPSGTLTWGEDDGCYSPGVYFIRSSSEEPSVTQKVILIK